jgi:hypothetical protein
VRRLQRLGHWIAGLGPGGMWGAARIVLGLLYPRRLQSCKRHITPQGAGVATGPVKFVVGALRRLDWTWEQVGDWAVCTYVCICGGDLDGAVGCWS